MNVHRMVSVAAGIGALLSCAVVALAIQVDVTALAVQSSLNAIMLAGICYMASDKARRQR